MDLTDKRAFPLDVDYEFKKRMYIIRIEKLVRKIKALEERNQTLHEQNDYYRVIIGEKNLLLKQHSVMINSLGDLLKQSIEDLS